MKKIYSLIIVTFCIFNLASAQWIPSWNSDTTFECCPKLITDSASNAYLFSYTDTGYVITKYDVNGNMLWSNLFANGNLSYGAELTIFNNNVFYLITKTCLSFPCTWHLSKLDTAGNIIQAITLDSNFVLSYNIWPDSGGNIFICYSSSVSLPHSLLISKYDSSLQLQYSTVIVDSIKNHEFEFASGINSIEYISVPAQNLILKFDLIAGVTLDTIIVPGTSSGFNSSIYDMKLLDGNLYVAGKRPNNINLETGFIAKYTIADSLIWIVNYNDSLTNTISLLNVVLKNQDKVFGLGVHNGGNINFIRIDDSTGNKEITKVTIWGNDDAGPRLHNVVIRNDYFYFVSYNNYSGGVGSTSYIVREDSAGNPTYEHSFNDLDDDWIQQWVEQPDGGIYVLTHSFMDNGPYEEFIFYYFNPTTVASFFNPEKSEQVKVFPNPVFNILQIELPFNIKNNKQYEVFDLLGKKCAVNFNIEGASNLLTADVSNLKAGCYILEINSGNKLYHAKFLKQDF